MIALSELFSATNTLLFFGIASGVLSTFAFIPYIIDTVTERTQPQRASWLIWSVLGSIAFMSQIFEGATSSLWFAGVQVSGTIIVFALSIKGGKGRFLSKTDYVILLAATLGLVLWYFTETAAYALAITISISLLGGAATVVKAYRDPDSETLITWVISLIASVCAILAVGKFDLIILAYPLYLFTLYITLVIAIVLGRLRKSSTERDRTVTTPRFSLPSTATVLRTTSDSIIVCAALAFILSWFNNQNYINNVTASFAESPALPSLLVATQSAYSGNGPALTSARALSEFSLPTVSQPLAPESTPVPSGAPEILIIALQLTESHSDQLWKLDDIDPLTQRLQAIISSHLAAESNQPDGMHLPTADPIALPFPITMTERHVDPVKENLNQLTSPPGDSKNFQFLDRHDPFTQLTVTSTSARLHSQTGTQEIILPHGTSLTAIATDGQWFRVQTTRGETGYFSREDVTLDALAMAQ